MSYLFNYRTIAGNAYYIIYSHRLGGSLSAFADEKDWDLSAGFASHFPEGIKLSQSAAAWAVLAQQEYRTSNQQTTNV